MRQHGASLYHYQKDQLQMGAPLSFSQTSHGENGKPESPILGSSKFHPMKRVFPILYFIMLATLLFRLPTLSAQQKWTIDAILEAERIIDPMVSPNGDHAFYLLGCTKNGYPVTPSEAYSITLDGGKIVCISTEKGLGNNYKWSPDSKWISFITDSPTIK